MTRHPGPPDFSETAHRMVARIIQNADPEAAEAAPEPSEVHVATGRKGGQARAKALSAAERAAIARQGGQARWADAASG